MTVANTDRMILARIGFFLCREGAVDEAEEIFAGLAESAPERDGPAAGLALCLIVKGDTDKAVELLDRHLAKGEECSIPGQLHLYRLLALGMGGRMREAERLRDDMELKGYGDMARTAVAILDDLQKVPTA